MSLLLLSTLVLVQLAPVSIAVDAAAGDVIAGVVDQGERDFVIEVASPQGRVVASIDQSPRSEEIVCVPVTSPGRYQLRAVTAGGTPPVRMTVTSRPRSAEDEGCIAASASAMDAKRLYALKNAASLRASIERQQIALEQWRRLGKATAELASRIAIGDAHYRLSEFDRARADFEEALAVARRLDDLRSVAELLNNGAMLAQPRGEVNLSRENLEEALAIWDRIGYLPGRASTLTNLGVLMWEAGELDRAKVLHADALQAFRLLGDKRGEAYALTNAGLVLDTLNRRDEALTSFSRAQTLLKAVGDRIGEGRVHVRKARTELAIGKPQAAIASIYLALPLIRESNERLAEGDALETLARAQVAAGAIAAGRASYDRALALYDAVDNRRGQSNVWHGRGLIALNDGDGTLAMDFFLRAKTLRAKVGVFAIEADSTMRLAQAARLAGQLDDAVTYSQDAIGKIEQFRRSVMERELRASYSGSLEAFYAHYADLLIDLDRARPGRGYAAMALEVVDRNKARMLVDLLAESGGAGDTAERRELVARERAARDALAYTAWSLWKAAERPENDEAQRRSRARLEVLVQQHSEAEAALRRSDGRLADALVVPSTSISAIQSELAKDRAVLVEYAAGIQRHYVWVVTPHDVSVVTLNDGDRIDRLCREYHALTETAAGRSNLTSWTRLTSELSRLLVDPIANRLSGQRLFVVAHGPIHYVPFSALLSTEVLSLPSASLLPMLRERSEHAPVPQKLLAVFADPVFSTTDPRVRSTVPRASPPPPDVALDRRLVRLAFSRDEANAIATLAAGRGPGQVALDFQASVDPLIRGDLEGYRYVHLATHAVADAHPDLAAIVFSLVRENGAPQNGFLRLQQIYHLRLNADLVVLSACSTALGQLAGAEGMLGLSRGILYAGARRVMVSAWDVDDAATAELMKHFYASLFSGTSPVAALQAAQARLRASKRFAHPYFWAGWMIQGAAW